MLFMLSMYKTQAKNVKFLLISYFIDGNALFYFHV